MALHAITKLQPLPSLGEIVRDASSVASLSREAVIELIKQAAIDEAQAKIAQSILLARLASPPEPESPAPVQSAKLLTLRQAAGIIGKSREWLSRHHQPFMKKVGNTWRIDERALKRWMDRQ